MQNVIEGMKMKSQQPTTITNYHSIWKSFNEFIIRLDEIPDTWEERLTYYVAYCVLKGMQSSTVKSYISAIKFILAADGHDWKIDKALLTTLTRTCKLENDVFKVRFPIKKGLLNLLLLEIERKLAAQPYLEILYKTIFCLAYYGMMRIGELAKGSHTVLAKDIHVSRERGRMLLLLHSSKTHGKGSKPQKIIIKANFNDTTVGKTRSICPFEVISFYLEARGNYLSMQEPLFIFQDKSPVLPSHVRRILRSLLRKLNLNPKLYDTHSFRIGRATDLAKHGTDVEEIKRLGRWRSNAVYKYLKL